MIYRRLLFIIVLALLSLTFGGCFSKVDRMTTNYYILDYKKATENSMLRVKEPFPKLCEVFDTDVNRTYNRNQMVVKENFSKVSYLSNELWANRLSDAIPNLIVQRLKAYNLFRQVERSTGDVSPNYYLETNLLSIEMINTNPSQASLVMEFKLRDAASQRVLVTHKHEAATPLLVKDIAYVVDVYNDMIMDATDIFAAKCRMFLEGKPTLRDYSRISEDPLERYLGTQMDILDAQTSDGELLLVTSFETETEILYSFQEAGVENPVKREGTFGNVETVPPGKYKILLGENQDYPVNVQVDAKRRTVVSGEWGELIVLIHDQNQTKVRMGYNLWKKRLDTYDYYYYGSDTSLGEEDFGQKEKVWILSPGTYMIKLGSGPWNELKDFSTVSIQKGDSKLLTVVVDPAGETNYMLGAGLLGNKEIVLGKSKAHKGTLMLDFNLSASNEISNESPSYDVSFVGRTDNHFERQYKALRFNARSLYSLGLKLDNHSDLRVNPDAYSLKNVFLYTPLRKQKFFRNFSFYGRTDVSTHFFDEYLHFTEPRNVIFMCDKGDTLFMATDQEKVRTKIAFFPLRLKEGLGITYRWVLSPKFSASIRGGYGWQQDMNKLSYTQYLSNVASAVPGDTLRYDVFKGTSSTNDSGIESTLVISAISLLRFLSVNSSIDVLFPMGDKDKEPRLESETRFNIKLYRNLSMDVSINLEYDQTRRDWFVYNYNSYLRLSIFY